MTKRLMFMVGLIFAPTCEAKNGQARDPFFLPMASKEQVNVDSKKSLLRLQGIVQSGDNIGALIRSNKRTSIVLHGSVIDGYTVEKISMGSVVLAKGKKTKTLTLE